MNMIRRWIPLGVIFLWTLVATLGPSLPLAPNSIKLSNILVSGTTEAWLGFDDLGRPIFDRLIVGAQTSFFVAFSVVAISLVVGSCLSLIHI